ncbi:envelope glycoprotein E [Psittacid alphaherpesvirus 5]|uniref:Envelope glycoprotein E n=1 Tax=Psittacid alphaherpesvirus 5 TaxID=2972693 RepID=A0A5P9JQF7_9ALPH|nr:envelope glycoprotein E [Psittacid alphaherpesvirus 5]QFU14613.1 envelope glycoprotein E [Psittacid alphaherpesvirus 5]UOO01084.1 envelope glycoprotein E [Psittacid alphaherpesvirus 5]
MGSHVTLGTQVSDLQNISLIKWMKIDTRNCETKPTNICLSTENCFIDIVIDLSDGCNAHAFKETSITAMAVSNGTILMPVNLFDKSHAIMIGETLLLENITVDDVGIYARYIRWFNDTTNIEYMSLIVGNEFQNVQTHTSTALPRLVNASMPPGTSLTVSCNAPAVFIYDAYSSFTIPVVLTVTFKGGLGFNLEMTWFRLKYDRECPQTEIFEPCLYHPNDFACKLSEMPKCAFASPLDEETIHEQKLYNCRTTKLDKCGRLRKTIPHVPGIQMLPGSPNLVFTEFTGSERLAEENRAGLYVFIVRTNKVVLDWTYTLVSEDEDYIPVVVRPYRPQTKWENDSIGTYVKTGSRVLSRHMWVVFGVVLGLTVCLAIVVCYRMKNPRSRYIEYSPLTYDESEAEDRDLLLPLPRRRDPPRARESVSAWASPTDPRGDRSVAKSPKGFWRRWKRRARIPTVRRRPPEERSGSLCRRSRETETADDDVDDWTSVEAVRFLITKRARRAFRYLARGERS